MATSKGFLSLNSSEEQAFWWTFRGHSLSYRHQKVWNQSLALTYNTSCKIHEDIKTKKSLKRAREGQSQIKLAKGRTSLPLFWGRWWWDWYNWTGHVSPKIWSILDFLLNLTSFRPVLMKFSIDTETRLLLRNRVLEHQLRNK